MARQNFFQLTAVQVGGAICLPVILVGQMLGESYGLGAALLAVLVGNALLVALSCAMARLSVNYRESTPEVVGRFLGRGGARLFAATFLVVLLGWFSIQLRVMGMSVVELLGGGAPLPLVIAALGAAITAVALFGLRGITRLASLSMPLLVGTMLACAYLLRNQPTAHSSGVSGAAISVVIATAIAAVFDLPTYFRHARSSRAAMWSAVVTFGAVLPLVEGLGTYIGLKTPGLNLLQALTLGGGQLWTVWVLLFLVLAGWTTNNANLYSAGACIDLFRPMSAQLKGLLIGAGGTALALAPLLENFEEVLNGMGLAVISVGASVLVGNLMGKSDPVRNLLACGLGISAGICALSGMALIDAALVSAVATATLGRKRDARAEV